MEPFAATAILVSRLAAPLPSPVRRAPVKEESMNARPVVIALLAAPILAAAGGALLAGPTSGLLTTLIPKPGAVIEAEVPPIALQPAPLPAERVSRRDAVAFRALRRPAATVARLIPLAQADDSRRWR